MKFKQKFNQKDLYEDLKKNLVEIRNINKLVYIGQSKVIFKNNNEGKYFEVFCRFTDLNNKDTEIEFLFNDATTTAEVEKQKNLIEYKYKSLFLSKIAHEFKNPLICMNEKTLKTMTEIDKSNFENKDKIIKNFKFLHAMSSYLIILIKDLDYFSGSQVSRNYNLNETDFDLEETLEFCGSIANSIMKQQNKKKKIEFKIIKNFPRFCRILTDEWKLKQILINILSNAIKFTISGKITLEASLTLLNKIEYVKFSIKDTGIGITDEMKTKLFQPYEKENNRNNQLGAGLGLSIVKELVNKLKGKIEFTSEQNSGTCFDLYFPIKNSELEIINDQINKHDVNNSIPVETNSINKTILNNFEPNEVKINIEDIEDIAESSSSSDSINFKQIKKDQIYPNNNLLSSKNTIKSDYNKLIDNDIVSKNTNGIRLNFTISDFMNANTKDGYNIIVADDEKLTRNSNIRVILDVASRMNIKLNIFESEDGIETVYLAYKIISQGFKISFIFSDETMFYMKGTRSYQIIDEFMNNKNMNSIPFILVTAYEIESTHNSDFKIISKPLSKSNLEKVFKQYLNIIK